MSSAWRTFILQEFPLTKKERKHLSFPAAHAPVRLSSALVFPLLYLLFEVFYSALKQLHILFHIDVLCHVLSHTLGVSHLTKDTAVRADDALDGVVGTVRIVLDIHGRSTLHVDILGCHLTVLK